MNIIAWDAETFPIGPGAVAPKLVCFTVATRTDRGVETQLLAIASSDHLESTGCLSVLKEMLTNPDLLIVTHSGDFDYSVLAANYPELIPLIFDAMLSGRCTDTLYREKLLNLSTTGRLDLISLPDGSTQRIEYNLAALGMQYLGKDRSKEKEDLEESWRVSFAALDGWSSEDYPEDAKAYACDDASDTLLIYEAQEKRKADWMIASTATEHFQLASAFALRLMTIWGMEVNPDAVAEMRLEVQRRLDEVEGDLVAAGFLRAAQPSVVNKADLKRVVALLEPLSVNVTPEEILTRKQYLVSQGIKFTAGKESSVDTKIVQAYVAKLYQKLGEIPAMTPGGTRAPQIKLDGEVQEYLATKDPLMAKYHGRQALGKIVAQVEVLESGPIIYPNYDALKETGRTSSYGGGKKALYPSTNIQNVPNELENFDPRRCYRPRAGTCFFDVDFTGLELACVGQITYDLFGESVHLERYNAGTDLHGYLGGQLAVTFGVEGIAREFVEGCRTEGILDDKLQVYEAFMLCKKHEDENVRAFFKHWRDYAKTTGLGLPGGLGPDTMVDYAWSTYGVRITVEQATLFREVWRATYPEMPKYFDWITGQRDQYNQGKGDEQVYWYTTPLGMIRRGASFCAAANGKAMQSPGAEGAKIAVINVQRACYDPTMYTEGNPLYGCRPIAFVHDQIIGETTVATNDFEREIWHDQCMTVKAVMCASMKSVLPDVVMRSDEAHLTSVWTKASVPTFGEDGRLIPWVP